MHADAQTAAPDGDPAADGAHGKAPDRPRGLRMAGLIGVLVAAGIVVSGTISRSGHLHAAQDWSDATAVPTVELVPVAGAAGGDALTLPGTMEAWNTARLFPRVTGYVTNWYHDIGARVSGATPLGSIDTPELDQQIDQARADLASAHANALLSRSTAARWNGLYASHSVSAQEADEKNGDLAVKTAAVRGAQAALNRLLALKAYSTVRAPFAGIVTARNAQIGDLVGPTAPNQTPMFQMADVSRMRLYVSVPQAYADALHPGLAATLTVPDRPGERFDATVTGDSGAINSQTGALQVQLIARNAGGMLRPGDYAQVRFDLPGAAGIATVPATALIVRAAGTQLATVGADGRVRLRAVTVGRDLGSTVEILSGVKAGERVIDSPPDSLAAGERVRIGGSHA